MGGMTAELTVAPLAELRRRRSVKWRTFPDDVLPLFVAEMEVDLGGLEAAFATHPASGRAVPAGCA